MTLLKMQGIYRASGYFAEADREYEQEQTKVPCMLQFNGLLVPELKCKYLTLELCIENFDLNGVAGLLGALPHVETLNIYLTENLLDNYFCDFEENNTDLQSWISSIVFPNLKNITIVNSILVCLNRQKRKRGFRRLVKLSQLLLKNATILKKFLVISKSRMCKKCSSFPGLDYKLISFSNHD